MAAAIREYYRSPSSTLSTTDPRFAIAYKITGTTDHDEALTLLAATAPGFYGLAGILLSKRELDLDVEDYGIWNGSATFSKKTREQKEPLEEFQSSYSFETAGGTEHIHQSLKTIGVHVASGTPPNFKGAIGWNGQEIEGCDVVRPVFNWSETHCFPDHMVDAAYRKALYRATGKKNNAPFKGLETGEALFLGSRGSKRGDSAWEISFNFAGSETVVNRLIDDITVPEKQGWDYQWVYYEPSEDTGASILVRKPKAAIVEQVYEPWDFATIGIGT